VSLGHGTWRLLLSRILTLDVVKSFTGVSVFEGLLSADGEGGGQLLLKKQTAYRHQSATIL
jgi:hypothetical protein